MEITRRVRAVALAVIAGSSTWLGACSDSPMGPGIQPQILNQPDNLEHQVSDVQGFSGTLAYSWQNTGTSANVNQATTVSGARSRSAFLMGPAPKCTHVLSARTALSQQPWDRQELGPSD